MGMVGHRLLNLHLNELQGCRISLVYLLESMILQWSKMSSLHRSINDCMENTVTVIPFLLGLGLGLVLEAGVFVLAGPPFTLQSNRMKTSKPLTRQPI